MNTTEELIKMGCSITETLTAHASVIGALIEKIKLQDRKIRRTNFIIFVGGALSFVAIKGLGARVAELEKEKR